MDLGLNNKIAVVAASSSGLGKACARALALEGANVIISGRDAENLESTRQELQQLADSRVVAVQMDVTRGEDIDRLLTEVLANFDGVDILVNNAGGPAPGFFADISDEDWDAAYELTLKSSVRMTRAVLPFMRKQRWGRIINIASTTVKQPIDQLLLSNSLRLAVVGWAKTLSNQVAEEGITINNACPGWTTTERVKDLMQARAATNNSSAEDELQAVANTIPMKRLATPEEFADLVVFLASERARYITGTSIQVDGGTTAGFN